MPCPIEPQDEDDWLPYDADDSDDAFPEGQDDSDDGTDPCPHCGAEIWGESVQCPQCGQYLSGEDAPPRLLPLWIAIGVAAALLGMTWGYILH
jgi:hypothetical protein